MILEQFKGKAVLVIGGTGFLGSNLVNALCKIECNLMVVGRSIKHGGSKKVGKANVKYIAGDVNDSPLIEKLVVGSEYIVNFAGSGPQESVKNPIEDLKTCCLGTLHILESAKYLNAKCKILLIGSRLEFSQKHPGSDLFVHKPFQVYGVDRLALSHYARIYAKYHGLNVRVVRLCNVFGPHKLPVTTSYNVVNQFVDLAIAGKNIVVYGKGHSQRDYLYVDDVIEAILLSINNEKVIGKTIDIGSGRLISIVQIARMIVEAAGSGGVVFSQWPKDYFHIHENDISYLAGVRTTKRLLGWKQRISLSQGIAQTIDFQKRNKGV